MVQETINNELYPQTQSYLDDIELLLDKLADIERNLEIKVKSQDERINNLRKAKDTTRQQQAEYDGQQRELQIRKRHLNRTIKDKQKEIEQKERELHRLQDETSKMENEG
ncbi:hypothetical protein DFQ28_011664 [Apophysomyces sp. BC1034]|nr:hypothetical protein DFQ29_010056 [Apophysomyces sp. BC1021]KAG0184167.1 hypothetical protein DFQ28_011664 [Apophysomyces sp. BC1034]